ncbi:MAG: Rrf2 family transcriptional regulator [Candidatus Liptonbacteria bacterium]|nr:Rrf2 family transcriptional regulator [Candidatus Liptonbacteria bacterium]
MERGIGEIRAGGWSLPRVSLLAGRENVSINPLAKHLHVSRPIASRILYLLEKEGLVEGPAGPRPRIVLASTSSPAKSDAKPPLPPLEYRIRKVEALIRTIGEGSELARILRSLTDEAIELRDIKLGLRGLISGALIPGTKNA